MSDESKPSLLSYSNIVDDDQAKLEVNENAIATLLLTELGIRSGAGWTSSGEGTQRLIRLIAKDHTPETIFEITSVDIAELSASELLSEISHVIRQM